MVGIRADVTLNVNTSKAKRSMDRAAAEINRSINGISKKQVSFNVNSKSFTQPLGRITASANEFTKSLEASNARVIAFGASVGIINGVSEAFKALVVETVKFEKVLQDINVIVGASAGKLQEFGDGLFNVARNTAQAFTVSAEAALEFSRQGLTMEETLRRTNDALILTRLTGLDAASAVSGLTAAVNAFGDAGLSTTDIIDKLAAVDVKFAVSSEDLIKALERTGAVAIDAGVEIDSLIGLVAALQQTTARGGAVIGNGLKTIFTRIQRPESIRQLEEIGIAVKNLSGSILPADKIMINMAKSFDNLSQSQKSNIVQFSAGIFQANVFRAALRDLGKEQSIQAQATEIAGNAAGDAAQKNEMLNKTMAAMASQTTTSIQELAEILGSIGLAPDIDFFLSSIKDGVDGIKNALGGGEDEGSAFAKGLVKGIGNVITGPAALAFGAIFIKLFVNIAKFARTSLKDVLGIVSEKDKIRAMEESILKALGENIKLQEGLSNLEDDRKAQEMFILGIIEKQNSAMSEQVNLAARLAKPLVRAGINPDFTQNGASGMVPIAASGMIPESSKKKERRGAAQGGYAAGAIDSMNVKGVGTVVYNKAEKVKQFPGMSQPAIMPPEQSRAGRTYKDTFAGQHGFDPYASGGFIPNYALKAKKIGNTNILQLPKAKMFVETSDKDRVAGGFMEEKMRGWRSIEVPIRNLKNEMPSYSKHLSALEELGFDVLKRSFYFSNVDSKHKAGRSAYKAGKKDPKRVSYATGKAYEQALSKSKMLKGKGYKSTQKAPDAKLDFISKGRMPLEAKYGSSQKDSLMSKSIRLSGDKYIEQFLAKSGFGGVGSALSKQKLEDSKEILRKMKLGSSDADVEAYRLFGGFIPSFNKKQKIQSITGIKDGDSIDADVVVGVQNIDHRLKGVDAVEKNQPFGTRATTIAKNYYGSTAGKKRLESTRDEEGKAAYRRGVFDDADLSEELVVKGFGVPDRRYLTQSVYKEYDELVKFAQKRKVGMWGKNHQINKGTKENPNIQYTHNKAELYTQQNKLFSKGERAKNKMRVGESFRPQKGYGSGYEGIIPNFIDKRTRQQKIQDVLRDPANKGINFKGGNLGTMSIKSKNMFHQMFLESYVNKGLKSDYDMLVEMGYDPKQIQAARKHKQGGGIVKIMSGGLVPNFANPLSDAIAREKAAGVSASSIRIEKSNELKSPQNPMGLAVTNTRDEPAGVQQGIRRARTMGIDPKKHGASMGMVPNFATPQIPDAILNNAKNELSEMSKAFTDSFSEFSKIANQFGKEGKETLAEIASFDISKDFEGIKDLLKEKLERTEAQINSITEKTGKLSKGEKTRLGKLKKAKLSGEALLKSTEEKSQKSKAVKNLSSSEPEAQKAQLIKSENAMIKKMLTARGGDLKSLKEATKASQDFRIALDESARAAEKSEDDGGGLQRLFYLQSAISLVNGQFETLAEGASGLTKTFAEGMLAVSNVTASFIQQKELVSEGMNMAGVKRNESFSIGQAFNPEARAARRSAAAASDAKSRGAGVGKMGGLMRNLSGVGKMFGRFLPVIGQLYTGFTVVNEAFKMFNIGEMFGLEKGAGVMDILSTQGERAAKKLEKLGESTEKLQGALEALNSQTKNNEKITNLEILGSRRTQKQETELQQLKLKGLDIDIKAQDALSGLLEENLVGTKVSKRFIGELSKGTNSNEDYVKVIERLIRAQKKQESFLTGSKNFGDLIESKLDNLIPDSDDISLLEGIAKVRGSQMGAGFSSSAAGEEDMDVKDRLSILNKNISVLEKESSNLSFRNMGEVSRLTNRLKKNLEGTEDFDAEMMASQINSFIKNIDESIDNTTGLDPRETKAVQAGMKQMVIQLNRLKKNLEEESGRHEEAQLKKKYVTAYKNIIFNIEQFRKNEAQLTKLSLASLTNQNKLNSSQQSLLLEYGAIGKEAAISSDFARKRNAMEAKFIADKQGVERKTIESLDKLRDTYFNTDQLAQDFKKDGKEAAQAVQALKDNIKKGVSAADFAGIGKSMNLDPEVMAKVTEAFEQTSAETKDATSSLEVISSLLEKFGKATDSSTASALLLALHEKKLVTITDEHLNLLKSGLLDRERQLELLNTGNKEAQQLLKLEEEHKFIKEKTVTGAAKLYKILEERGRTEKDVLDSVRGEAATLAVLNDFYKKDASILAKSSAAMELGFQKQVEKNRADAASSVHSLRMLEAQTGSLKNSENSLIILESKLKSETENAKLALQESQFRLKYLSDQSKRSELVGLQLAKEMADLQTSNLLAAEKNQQLSSGKKLSELVEEQLNATLHSSRLEALTAAENALLLTGKTKQVKLIQEANELQEASNKLTELQNAVTKAGVSDKTLRMTTTADIGIEKANSILETRTAGMKATVEPNAENMLAYANSLERSNKLVDNASTVIDRFRVKMAEMNVEAENLGADLVNIGIDNARSGLTQMFKDIGSGAKSASEAWADFGLGLANVLLDRLMQNNVDKIIKNLTFAFTGESGESDASKIAKETAHLVGINEGIISSNKDLTSAVRDASEALRNKIQLSQSPDEQVNDVISLNTGKTPDTLTNVQENAAKIQADLETSNKIDLEVSSFIENLYKPIVPLSELATAATEAAAAINKESVTTRDLFEAQNKVKDFKANEPLFQKRNSGDVVDQLYKNEYEAIRAEEKSKRTDLIDSKDEAQKKAEGIKAQISEIDSISNPTREQYEKQKQLKQELEKAKQEITKFSNELNASDKNLAGLDSKFRAATTSLAALEAKVTSLTQALNMPTKPELDLETALSHNHSGGKIQRFAKGGFVDGPAGVDKVPAMLTAGEYVVPKDKASQLKKAGGIIQHFQNGTGSKGAQKQEDSGTKEKKEKSRFLTGIEGIANLVVMNEVSRAVADSMDGKPDSPPTFDKNKFKNLDLRSDVNIKRGDPRLSSKFLSRDPVMQQYKDFLLEKAAYDVQKKNEKFEKRKATLATVVGAVQSMAVAGVTEIAAPFIAGAVKGLENTYGKYAPTDNAKAYRAARAQDPKLNVNYRDVKNSMKNRKPLVAGESSYIPVKTKEGGFTWDKLNASGNVVKESPSHRFPDFNKKNAQEEIFGIKRASGGAIPAMLTAGEGFIPAKTAKRIGYENLNTMNKTGSLPTVQGAPGIDQVGPVGLTEGDFIIKKNSTDKLLRENPSMMKFALQNPEGFKKGERGYYEGGVVGSSSPAAVAQPTKPRPTNRIQQQNPAEMLNSITAPKTQTPQVEAQGKSNDVTNNINVNVTIDQSGQEKVSSDSSGGSYEEEQNLSLKIKTAVLDVIRQEKRIGGELN